MSKPVIDIGEVWRCGDTSLDVLIARHGRKEKKITAIFDNGVIFSFGHRGDVLLDLLESNYTKLGDCSGFSLRKKQ